MSNKTKVSQIKSYLFFSVMACLSLITIISFQNCTQPLDLEEGSLENSSEAESDSKPFAYEVSIDHIAMMTCQTANKRDDSKFTFKWGAYNNGLAPSGKSGVKLSTEFMNTYGREVPARKQILLSESPKNKDLRVVSAFYLQDFSQNVVVQSGADLMVNDHERLNVDYFIGQLISEPDMYHNYFKNIVAGSSLSPVIEGKLYRASSTQNPTADKDEFTQILNTSIRSRNLVVGFSHSSKLAGSNKPLISQAGTYNGEAAQGKSFNMSYGGINTFVRHLTSIRETSLPSNQLDTNSWSCPAIMRFKVVNKEDKRLNRLNGIACNPVPITTSSLASNPVLRSVANMIDIGYWDIDITNRCIIRKSRDDRDSCYDQNYHRYINKFGAPESYNALLVDYAETRCTDPERRLEIQQDGTGVVRTFYVCPHYVSICVKR